MGRRKTVVAWTLGAVGALIVAAFAAAALLLPGLAGREPLKGRILAEVSRRTGGTAAYERIDLVFFPRPGVVVRRPAIALPGKLRGTFDSLTVYPRLLPLLAGRFHPARIEARAPAFTAPLPETIRKPGEPLPSIADIEGRIASALAEAASRLPGLAVSASGGRLDLARNGATVFSFRDVEASVRFPPGAVTARVACRSSLFERLSAAARLDPRGFKGQATVAVTRFRPRDLADWLAPGRPLPEADSVADLSVSLRAAGIGVLEADVEGSTPSLVLTRGDRRRTLKSVRLAGTFRGEHGTTTVSLRELALGSPGLALTGRLLLDPAAPRVEVEAGVRDADLSSLRDAALALADDVPAVRRFFDVVRGGRVPTAAVRIRARSPGELGKPENIVVTARVAEGTLHIPGPDLDLASAAGDVSIAQGILEGRRLSARMGNSRGRDGKLTLGLSGKAPVFRLDAMVHADVSELPPLLSRLIAAGAFHDEIERIGELRGEADGRLILGDDTARVKARVDVSDMRLAGRYARIPFPVAVSRGRFTYDGEAVTLGDLAGTVGASSITGVSAKIRVAAEPSIEELSGNFSLALGEIYPWLGALKDGGDVLRGVGKLEGRADVAVASLRGPLREPSRWEYAASGEARNLEAVTADVPGPVTVESGTFRAAPAAFSFRGVRGRLLDAALSASGSLRGPVGGVQGYDLSLDGVVGPEAAAWVAELVRLPREFRVRPPVSLSGGRLSRDGGATSFSGTLGLPDGAAVALAVRKDDEGLGIDNLVVRDSESDARIALRLGGKTLSGRFAGTLTHGTIDRIFPESTIRNGRIEGSFQADIRLDRPGASEARGRLEGRDLVVPLPGGNPVAIETVSLEAAGNAVRVGRSTLTWTGQRLSLAGELRFAEGGVRLDLDVESETLDADRILAGLAPKTAARPPGTAPAEAEAGDGNGKGDGRLYDLPLSGTLRVKARRLQWGRYAWSPFGAGIALSPESVTVSVSDGAVCGVATPGTLSVARRDVSVDFDLSAAGRDIDPVLECLTGKKYEMSGPFAFRGHVSGRGAPGELVRSLNGDFTFEASKGRIRRFNLLSKILAVVNLTELFRGKFPDLGTAGFAYNSINAGGTLENGKLVLKKRARVDGTTMGILARGSVDLANRKVDMVALVAPLRTIDAIIRKIPVVRYILRGSLVSIPVGIEGDIDDPKITPLPPSAIEKDMLGLLERILKSPIKIIEPFIGGREKSR